MKKGFSPETSLNYTKPATHTAQQQSTTTEYLMPSKHMLNPLQSQSKSSLEDSKLSKQMASQA